MPAATAVNVTVHEPDVKVQLAPTVPTAVFEDVKLTVPVGVLDAVVVSVTVTVQVEVPPGAIEPGLQETPVVVLSLLGAVTVIELDVPELVLCVPSPP